MFLLSAIPVMAFRVSEMICIVEIILYPLMVYTVRPAWLGKAGVTATTFLFFVISLFFNKILYL